ncbi:MAG TPA: aminoacyl-tRNA deacylase [Candidatus Binatia bacterium]|nr:aminoacyl-tRNA deacylase [Candidatus Binatia bacterium]
MTSTPTRAVLALRQAGVPFTLHEVETPIAPGDARSRDAGSYGEAVARALGVDPGRMFKTLVVAVDGRFVCALVPVAASLDLRALASACGGRRASLADPVEAERATGYVVGGISPFGQRRRLPVVADRSLLDGPTVFVNGGRRGLQVALAPADLVALTGATLAGIAR